VRPSSCSERAIPKDVLWLDVAVDDLVAVGAADRAGDLDRVGDRLVDRQPPHAADALLERLTLDVLEDDVGPVLVLAGVDHADDVRVREAGDRARLAAEALELVGVRRDLAVHELDRHRALQREIERPVDRGHSARPDAGVQPVAAAELHADERAHDVVPIVADIAVVSASVFTDPFCPWSWASEPQLGRLSVEFADSVAITFVIVGLRKRIEDAADLAWETVEASGASGMPADPRVFMRDPPSSTHPAGLAIHAVAEQDGGVRVGAYLRRLREAIMLERRRMDSAPALLDAAREVGGIDAERLRLDFGSSAILERFGADLERAAEAAPLHHDPATGRVVTPSVEFRAEDGRVHGIYGYTPWEGWRAAAIAAGAEPGGEPLPDVHAALARFGALATPEVAAVCDIPAPRAAAELWQAALEWKVRPRRVLAGELWEAV
jgi:putative protein-disulfide isomerase